MTMPFAFFKKIRAVVCVPAAILGVVSLMGCESEKGGRILNEDKLQEIKMGSVVRLSDLIHENAEAVCVLHPYQDKVADRYPESAAINKYLSSIKYQVSESYWSLVVLTSGSAMHYKFKRSKNLDIFSAHGLKSS
ncbi:MAG: hypothetical protein PHP05_09745, partial [Sideroxydans sp.]|nr:hypothetical protein [Sideroxydans sp.]